MDAIALLKSDHDGFRALFAQFSSAAEDGNTTRMGELRDRIIHELDIHTAIEEEVFYPQIRAAIEDVEDIVLEGVEEHHVADLVIAEVRSMAPDAEPFEAKMTVLIENVEHHLEEEEEEMFPTVREHLDAERLAGMGEELAAAKLRHEAGVSDATKAELYAKAKAKDVPGRSSMTKDELADAVTDK